VLSCSARGGWFFLGLASTLACGCSRSAEGLHPLDQGWEVRWGDSPRDADGRFLWLDEAATGWLATAPPPAKLPGREGARFLWMRTRLPTELPADSCVDLMYVEQAFEVFLGSERIYAYGTPDRFAPETYGRPWHLVCLGREAGGKRLSFRIYSEHGVIGPAGRVYVGDESRVVTARLRYGLPVVLLAAFFGLIGLAVAPFAVLRRDRLLGTFSAMSFSTGVYLFSLSSMPVKQMLWDHPWLWWHAERAAVYGSCANYFAFVYEALRTARHRVVFRVLFWVLTLLGAFSVGASLVGWIPLYRTLVPFELTISFGLVFALVTATRLAFAGGTGGKTLLAGFSALGLTSLHDVLVQMRVSLDEAPWSPAGFLCLITALGVLLLRHYRTILSANDRYARELEGRHTLLVRARDRIAQAAAAMESEVQAIHQASGRHLALAERQAKAIVETSTSAHEIAQTSQQATVRARTVVEIAGRSETLSHDGERHVEQSQAAVESANARVEEMALRLADLSGVLAQIGDIILTVREMAERSNLLALNASIQAAAAGEAGRGFAVVAAEMRELAQQSHDAAGRVRGLLGEVHRGTRSAVEATEQAVASAKDAIGRVREAGGAINGLAGVIRDASRAAQEIAVATEQQTQGVEIIVDSLSDVSDAMNEALDGTRRIEAIAQHLLELSQTLSDTLSEHQEQRAAG